MLVSQFTEIVYCTYKKQRSSSPRAKNELILYLYMVRMSYCAHEILIQHECTITLFVYVIHILRTHPRHYPTQHR